MSLLDESMETCYIMDKTTIPDGYGGVKHEWKEGAPIQVAIVYDSSMEARIGDAQGVTSLYTITTRKNINLQYHDIIKRKSDGKIFQITSDGNDNHTPASATLNMRQVSAEKLDSLPR